MKNKIHSLIVEGIVFCGSGLVLLSYSLSSYAKGFNKSWAQSPYLFPLIVAIAMIGLSLWIVGEGVTAMKKAAANPDDKKLEKAGKTEKRRWVVIALILCAIYYAALAFIKIPYITIGILSFAYTFSTFEVVTVVFLIAMMIFMARNGFTPGTGSEIQGKTLGIHAYGNVGRLVGRRGRAMGMNVIAYAPFITDSAVFAADGVKKVNSVEELYKNSDYLSLHIPATEQTKGSIGYDLLMSMPKGATLVNTARKEVIDEEGLMRALTEREDLKYVTDIAAGIQSELNEKFGRRVFATAKKMGAETAEANINAGLAAANQIVDFFKNGNTRFQVNK